MANTIRHHAVLIGATLALVAAGCVAALASGGVFPDRPSSAGPIVTDRAVDATRTQGGGVSGSQAAGQVGRVSDIGSVAKPSGKTDGSKLPQAGAPNKSKTGTSASAHGSSSSADSDDDGDDADENDDHETVRHEVRDNEDGEDEDSSDTGDSSSDGNVDSESD